MTREEQLTSIGIELSHLRQELYGEFSTCAELMRGGSIADKIAALGRAYAIAQRLDFLELESAIVSDGMRDEPLKADLD